MSDGLVPCPLCDETFWNDDEVRAHVDRVHGVLGVRDVVRKRNAELARAAEERSLRRLRGGGGGG